MTLYDELGVPPDADEDAIKAAWRRKAKETHPDANPDDAAAPAHFQRALAAYETLSDPKRRAHYDETGEAPADGEPSIEERALAAIRNAFTAAVAETADRGGDLWPVDLLLAIERSLRAARRQFDCDKAANAKQEKRWTRLKERIKGKAFLDVVDGQIGVAQSNRAAMDHNIAVADRALEILKDGYDHQPDDPDDLTSDFTFEKIWATNLRRPDYYDVDPVTGLPRKFKFTRGGGG